MNAIKTQGMGDKSQATVRQGDVTNSLSLHLPKIIVLRECRKYNKLRTDNIVKFINKRGNCYACDCMDIRVI